MYSLTKNKVFISLSQVCVSSDFLSCNMPVFQFTNMWESCDKPVIQDCSRSYYLPVAQCIHNIIKGLWKTVCKPVVNCVNIQTSSRNATGLFQNSKVCVWFHSCHMLREGCTKHKLRAPLIHSHTIQQNSLTHPFGLYLICKHFSPQALNLMYCCT